MSQALLGRTAVRAKQIRPGQAFAVAVEAGQAVEIVDTQGRQVAEFVAFGGTDAAEHVSTAATRSANGSIMIEPGMRLLSNRRTPMFELVEDTVGRHDLLTASMIAEATGNAVGPPPAEDEPTTVGRDEAGATDALADALAPFGVTADQISDPVNWFGHVAIKGRGELEVREPLSERNDRIVIEALVDAVVGVRAAPAPAEDGVRPRGILVRVYR